MIFAACILSFSPFTRNSNFIKEVIWWSFFPLTCGIYLLFISRRDAIRLAVCSLRFWKIFKVFIVILGVFFLWSIVQLIRTPDKVMGYIYLARQFGFYLTFLAFALLINSQKTRVIFLRVGVYAASLASVYALFQYFKIDFVKWSDLRRPPGTFANPNFSADFFAAFIPLAFIWDTFLRGNRRRNNIAPSVYFFNLAKMRNFPINTLLLLIALISTQSRSGLIGIVSAISGMSVLLSIALRAYEKNRENSTASIAGKGLTQKDAKLGVRALKTRAMYLYPLRLLLIGILIILLIIAGISWAMPEKFSHVLSSTTVQLRLLIWEGCWILFKEKPVMGWGLGSFDLVSQKIKYLAEPIAGNKSVGHAHNWILESLVEHGVLGASLFILMIAAFFIIAIRRISRSKNFAHSLFIISLLSSLIAILSENLFDVWFDWWDGRWLFWVLLGFTASVIAGFPQKGFALPQKKKAFIAAAQKNMFRTKAIGAFIFIVSLVIGGNFISLYKKEISLFKAQNFILANRFSEGLDILNSVTESFPFPPAVKLYKAFCFLNLKQPEKCESLCKELIEKEPQKGINYVYAGQAMTHVNNYDAILLYFSKAYEAEPSGENAINLARILISRNEMQKGLDLLQAHLKKVVYPPLLKFYLKIENDCRSTYRARDFIANLLVSQPYIYVLKDASRAELSRWEGELSFLLKDFGRSIASYHVALLYNPGNCEIYNDFGLVFKAAERYKRAERMFAKGEEVDPNHYAPAFNRLELAILVNDYKTAKESAQKVSKMKLPSEGEKRLKIINDVILKKMEEDAGR